jgi:predicted DsbA family dithiol-disulfide isomerase/uncharacterized membrane protein
MVPASAPSWRELLLRAAALVGLGASSFLLVDYLRPAPIFCNEGCDVIRLSEYSSWLGVPTPVFGVAFFAIVLLLSLARPLVARRLLLLVAGVGALAAGGFIYLQLAVLHSICKYCMVVDIAAIIVFLGALLTVSSPPRDALPWWTSFFAAGAAVILLPFGLAWARSQEMSQPVAGGVIQEQLPEPIAREQKPGVVTIVEFVDFECPVCRRFHGSLKEAVAGFAPGTVRVVRKHRPLRSIHAHAESAAKAACCAAELGKGEEMADRLFAVATDELDEAGTSKLAVSLGLDENAFKECLASARSAACVNADENDAEAAGVPEAAPIFWVGKQKFEGARKPDVLKHAIEQAMP